MKKILLITLIFTALFSNAQCWERISSGERHNIGIKTDGTLWGWGYNGDYGAVGNGNDWTLPAPVQIGTGTTWASVSSSALGSFAITESGILWGWGANDKGQLGTGSTAQWSLVPIQVGTSTWKMVRNGRRHTVGIKTDGTLWAWGNNEDATIGDGTFVNKSVPVLINSSTNWKTIDCNDSRNIAIKEDGTLWVWGFNSPVLGVLGSGSSVTYITVPTQVGTETNWKEAVAGTGHFIALKNDNTLWTWGGGDNGQLGNGNTSPGTPFPTQVGTDSNWSNIAVDNKNSFAIKADGTLWAWGQNNFGQLGNGTQINLSVPTQITTDADWKVVASSYNTTIALKTDNSLYSWGSNQFGTLGNGTFVNSLIPLLINACNLGAEDFNQKKVNLYPNPVQNRLFIDSEETQQYQIYSILGSKISEGTLAVGSGIDCSGLTSGVYLISLTNGLGQSSTLKFVKQ
jgi:hypothetical protein